MFSCDFCENFKNTFFTEHFRTTASEWLKNESIFCILQTNIILFQALICIYSLPKIPQFHLISWCGNFGERHSFRMVSGVLPETMQNCDFPQKLLTRKLGEITVFFAVILQAYIWLNELITRIYRLHTKFIFHVENK